MKVTEEQSMALYAPWSNRLTAVVMGICGLALGIGLPFPVHAFASWPYFIRALVVGLLLVLAGLYALAHAWSIFHHPTVLINPDGICKQELFLRMQMKWEEIDAMYRINARQGEVLAVDLSPDGLAPFFARHGKQIPRRMNMNVPQTAFGIPAANLPLSVNEILAQIRERFAAQLERYQVEVDDGQEEHRTDS